MTSFTQLLDTCQQDNSLLCNAGLLTFQRDVQLRSESFGIIRSEPHSVVLFQGDQSPGDWSDVGDRLVVAVSSDDDFSTATYIFFHMGWLFFLAGIVLLAGGFFVDVAWIGILASSCLLIGLLGFWQCRIHAESSATQKTRTMDYRR